jgi:hypothetical protein
VTYCSSDLPEFVGDINAGLAVLGLSHFRGFTIVGIDVQEGEKGADSSDLSEEKRSERISVIEISGTGGSGNGE